MEATSVLLKLLFPFKTSVLLTTCASGYKHTIAAPSHVHLAKFAPVTPRLRLNANIVASESSKTSAGEHFLYRAVRCIWRDHEDVPVRLGAQHCPTLRDRPVALRFGLGFLPIFRSCLPQSASRTVLSSSSSVRRKKLESLFGILAPPWRPRCFRPRRATIESRM
ncbi:hypothetical protein B0H19DRAFT_1090768 [Mycena capillaripes]|nr:hypothetical protein B0H19DRAFT_1204556 [Mycena capillaripes]KAJ6593525.1 hypothetical protein B0H19DRAFT_1090768 [Mycena capillaripes]